MESFHWNTSFETGLPTVDEQHHRLVELINQFGELLVENKIELNDLEKVFEELVNYTQYHFSDEEQLSRQIGVDQRHIDYHVKKHEEFLQEVVLLHASISVEKPNSVHFLYNFLTHWLAYHILGMDQDLARQIHAIESGTTAAEAYEVEETERDKSTGALLASLDGLFEQVSARNRELTELNQTLEERVALRTRELSEANLHLEELSLTDVLTGLPNRRHAMRRLASLWDEASQSNSDLVCMMIDADHFKEVNDTHGHDAGDFVLTELARTLKGSVRTDDIVCRLGGDEFFVICPNTPEDGGMLLAEIIRKNISELRVPTGTEVWPGSISVGVAAKQVGIKNYDELIKVADNGVYAAKKAGKNCVRSAN